MKWDKTIMKKEYIKAALLTAGLSLSAVSYAFGDGAFAAAHAGGGFAGKGNFAGGHRFANADKGTFLNRGNRAPVFNHAGNSGFGGNAFNHPVANNHAFNSGNNFQNAPANFPQHPGQFTNKFQTNNGFNLPNTNRPLTNTNFANHPVNGTYSTTNTVNIHSSSHSHSSGVSMGIGPVQVTPYNKTVMKTHTTVVTSGKGIHTIPMGPGPVIMHPLHNSPVIINKPIVIHNGGWNRPPVIVNNHYYPSNPYYWHHYPTCYHYPCYWHGYTYYNNNDVNTFLATALAISLTANMLQLADSHSHYNNTVYTTPAYGATTFVPYSTTYVPVTNTTAQFVPYVNPDQVAYANTSAKNTSNKTSSTSSTAPVYVTVNTTVNNTTPTGTTSTTTTTTSSDNAAPAAADASDSTATPTPTADAANTSNTATADTAADNLAATTAVPVNTTAVAS